MNIKVNEYINIEVFKTTSYIIFLLFLNGLSVVNATHTQSPCGNQHTPSSNPEDAYNYCLNATSNNIIRITPCTRTLPETPPYSKPPGPCNGQGAIHYCADAYFEPPGPGPDHVYQWCGSSSGLCQVVGHQVNLLTGQCSDPNVFYSILKTLGGSQSCMLKGNPINPATGNKFQIEIDIPSSDALFFTRYYNSLAVVDYGLGNGWSAAYFQHLNIDINDVSANFKDGQNILFSCPPGAGPCTAEADVVQILDKDTTGYTLTDLDDRLERYNLSGQLLTITPRSGEVVSLSYNTTSNLLESVSDVYGNELNFAYDVQNRLTTLTNPDGEIYIYNYDSALNNLLTVTYPDETPGNLLDNPKREYQYNDNSFKSYLTDIIDENGNLFAKFGYNFYGRAVFSEHANGNEKIDITYNSDGTTTVTDSLGASNTYSYETTFGVPKTSTVSGSQCGSGCSGEGQAQTYDANGFLASRTDFEGNLTSFINNSRGLQESRTEAVGSPEERTITTEWHPDFRLPTKITEPGKETVFTYDTQGKLLSRTEREI